MKSQHFSKNEIILVYNGTKGIVKMSCAIFCSLLEIADIEA